MCPALNSEHRSGNIGRMMMVGTFGHDHLLKRVPFKRYMKQFESKQEQMKRYQ